MIGTIKQLDQKNRLHIPIDLLKAAEIDQNSFVNITFDEHTKCIQISKLPDEVIKRICK